MLLLAPGIAQLKVEVDLLGLYARLAPDVERPERLILLDVPPDVRMDSVRARLEGLEQVLEVRAPEAPSSVLEAFAPREEPFVRHALLGKPATDRRMVAVTVTADAEQAVRAAVPEARLVGAPVLERAHAAASRAEQVRLGMLLIPGLLLALWGLTRRLGFSLVVLGSIGLGAAGLAGGMGYAGASLGGPNLLLLPLVVVLGLADAVHLGHQTAQRRDEGHTDPAVQGLLDVAIPCALTSLTTALAFLTLLLSPSPAVQQFGLLASFGMGVAWVAGLIVPSLFLSAGWVAPPNVGTPWARTERRWWVAAGVWTVVFGGLAFGLQPDLRLGGELAANDPVLAESREVDHALGGVHPMIVQIETGKPNGTADADAVSTFLRVTAGLQSHPAVGALVSYEDPLRWIARAQDMEPERLLAVGMGRRWRDRRFAKVHRAVLERLEQSPVPLFDDDRSAFVIHLRLHDVGAAQWASVVDRAVPLARPMTVEASGYPALVVGAYRQIVPEVTRIVGASLLAVLLVLGVRTRRVSAVVGGVGVLAGVVLTALGAMRLLGLPLSHTNVFVLSLAVGLGLDGWIHLCASARPDEVVPAIVRSAGVSGVGFLLLGLSTLPAVRGIGGVLFLCTGGTVVLTLGMHQLLGRHRAVS